MTPFELVETFGGRFSKELGIDLSSGRGGEAFKWLLAAILFGARISRRLSEKAYFCFERHALLTPRSILDAGWQGIVDALDEGGYARYDFKTATKLLEVSGNLLSRYGSDLSRLHSDASGPEDLEERLKALSKGIGPLTVEIFLREMRGIWEKAKPRLSVRALDAAKDLGYVDASLEDREAALERLRSLWKGEDFPDFEAALVRYSLAQKR